jgi:hypothetical protein
MRDAMKVVFGNIAPEARAEMVSRGKLLYSEPDLRSAAIGELIRSAQMMMDEIAARTGRPADDLEVRVFAGALVGAFIAAVVPVLEDPKADFFELADKAIDFLDKGMPL